MKCATCGYQEYVSPSDLALLRQLPPISKEDKQLCPFCLNYMYRADSLRFYKDNIDSKNNNNH